MSEKKPDVESSKMAHRGFFDLRIDTLKKEDQETLNYTTLLTKTEAVVILAQTEDLKWVLTHEYRHSVGEYVIGVPGGRVEKGENFAECAKRELLEETGFLAEKMLPMGISYPLPSICDQKLEFFFAPQVRKEKEPNLDPFEYIEILLLSDKELKERIKTSSNVDGAVLTALTYKELFEK